MGTYAAPFDGDYVTDELSLRLCELLHIDPAQVTEIALTVEPGVGAVIRWDGKARVSLEDVGRAITGPPMTPTPDPWDGYKLNGP